MHKSTAKGDVGGLPIHLDADWQVVATRPLFSRESEEQKHDLSHYNRSALKRDYSCNFSILPELRTGRVGEFTEPQTIDDCLCDGSDATNIFKRFWT